MKKISNISKSLIVLAIIIVIAGVAMVITKGYEFDLEYRKHIRVEAYIGKQFDIKEIEEITKEVLKEKQTIIKEEDVFGQKVSIETEEISDEEYNLLTQKIKEKYAIEEEEFTMKTSVSNLRGKDIVKPYIIPYIVTAVLAIGYFSIRFKQQGIGKIILVSIIALLGMQSIYFSIVAIARIPVNMMFMPVSLMVYILTLLGLVNYFRNQRLQVN